MPSAWAMAQREISAKKTCIVIAVTHTTWTGPVRSSRTYRCNWRNSVDTKRGRRKFARGFYNK